MIKTKFIMNNEKDCEFLINILLLGILTALLNKKISIEDTQKIIFRYGIFEYLKNMSIPNHLLNIILLGMELEDVETLTPDKIDNEIINLINMSLIGFSDTNLSDNIYFEFTK